MAAGCGADKENAAPAPTAAVVVARRHGYAVRSGGLKKRSFSRARWLGRVPLRDITNLVAASSAAAEPEAPLEQESLPETPNPKVVLPAAAAGKTARYSLRKEFR
ncbi:hypothetical protein ACP70R_044331 [Stipagrostis hirtigluma subsp. patula]